MKLSSSICAHSQGSSLGTSPWPRWINPELTHSAMAREKCWAINTRARSAHNHGDVLSGLGFEQLYANVFVGRHAQHRLSSRNRRLQAQVDDPFLARARRQ